MKVLVNEEINIHEWYELLIKSKQSSPFQTPEYYNTINEIEGYYAYSFALVDQNEIKVLAVVTIYKEPGLQSFFSRRGIIYGGPVTNNETSDEIEYFLKSVNKMLSNKIIYVESRNFFDYSNHKETFIGQKWNYLPYVNFHLYLQGETAESLLKKFKYNRRREIKQSISQNAFYAKTNNLNKAKSIYTILEDLYKNRVKLPIPPFRFFEKQIVNGIIKVFLVEHNQKVIGGSFCPVLKNKGIYTFYYCGLRNYHKSIFPTHLAVLAAIEYAIKKKIPIFDFMGAGLKEEEYGVRSYKKAFGGELVEYGRYIKVLKPLLFKFGKVGLKILARFK